MLTWLDFGKHLDCAVLYLPYILISIRKLRQCLRHNQFSLLVHKRLHPMEPVPVSPAMVYSDRKVSNQHCISIYMSLIFTKVYCKYVNSEHRGHNGLWEKGLQNIVKNIIRALNKPYCDNLFICLSSYFKLLEGRVVSISILRGFWVYMIFMVSQNPMVSRVDISYIYNSVFSSL